MSFTLNYTLFPDELRCALLSAADLVAIIGVVGIIWYANVV